MRKNHELFWILEVLLLTPVVFFWSGIVSMMISGSETLFTAVVGDPFSPLRGLFVAVLCPVAAAWFAYDYLRENKKEKDTTHGAAKAIIFVSITTIVLVLLYLYGENR